MFHYSFFSCWSQYLVTISKTSDGVLSTKYELLTNSNRLDYLPKYVVPNQRY